jgi:nitroimidazol reductase NimA-like FMN-containing flavoprotein (pyridoxamine 5'-phosphate oxidase superfamily)
MEWVDEGLEILSEDECRRLLATVTVGRLIVSVGPVPIALPVNFGLLDGDPVFATGEGTKLRAALESPPVAFEADQIDELAEVGWSVLVVGEAREVVEPDELVRVKRLGVRSWVTEGRDHWIRIETHFVSGRRIVARTGEPSPVSDL